ncbi:MAG: sulfatase-like hydrolase/transferase, partial [Pseudonocardiaceae bacterium]
ASTSIPRRWSSFGGWGTSNNGPSALGEALEMTVRKAQPDASRVALVLLDTLRADHVGWYAKRDVDTPALDRLASRGVVFANAVSQFPSTRGSVSSIFTGLYPSQHGLVDRAGKSRRAAVPTLAEILASAGYLTAAFVGGNTNLKPVLGLTRGFGHVDYLPTTDGSVLVDRFEHFLEAGLPERFFCYLHLMDVHNPLPDQMAPPRLGQGLGPSAVEERMGQLVECYAAAVRLVDRHVAGVVHVLEKAGVLDDTLVIVTADHGEEHREHGTMLAHGRSLYRELLHVPLIMRLPGGASAGTVVDRPVQSIDLMPTILEAAGCPRAGLAGRSLLPAIQGEGRDPSLPAFSELLRQGRYCQSATTSTHQLIVSYQLEKVAAVSLADLEPGVLVNCTGQLIQTGWFLPTKLLFALEKPPRIRGPVDAVDPETGSLTVLGFSFRTDAATAWLGLEEEPIEPSAIGVGDCVGAVLAETANGGYRAVGIQRRKPGGKSHIVGTVERVRDLEDGFRLVTVLGTDIVVGSNVILEAEYRGKRSDPRKTDALTRVLGADYLKREVELYDLAADPCQARNIVGKRPDIAEELETQLAAWTELLATWTPVSTGSSLHSWKNGLSQ